MQTASFNLQQATIAGSTLGEVRLDEHWDGAGQRHHTYGPEGLHDNVGYNPFEGQSVAGWPVQVLSHGRSIMEFCIPGRVRGFRLIWAA